MTTGDTVEGRDQPSAPPRPAIELLLALLTGALAIAAAAYVQQLWRMRLQVPLYPSGDSLFTQTVARTVAEHGWVTTNPSIGAPYGASMQDLVVLFGNTTQLLLIRILAVVSDNGASLVNAMYVLGFGLVGAAAYLALRGLGLPRGVAIAIGIVFALIRYHFERSEGHLFLGLYYAIPALAWLLYGLLGNHDLVRRREGVEGWRGWLSRRTLLTVAVALLVGTSEVYYAVFCLILLVLIIPVVGLVSGWRRAAVAVGLSAVIGASALAVQLPSLVYKADNGSSASLSVRTPVESEVYGLRLADMIVPDSYHRFGPAAEIGRKYFDNNNREGEERFSSLSTLGTLGAIGGLLVLLASALGRTPATREGKLIRDSGILVLFGFLIGTVGGFGTIFAYLVSPTVRGWNRISIVIAFFALVAVAAALTIALRWLRSAERPEWLRRGRRSTVAGVALTVFVAWFGVWDQTSPALVPAYDSVLASWRADARFVEKIDDQLPSDAMVLELPYVPFPEAPVTSRMTDYDHFFGYAHSDDLRWSYGASKGREPEDWGPVTTDLAAPALVRRAAAAGFSGIVVDTWGYTPEEATALVDGLSTALGGQKPITSADGRRVFLDLTTYATQLKSVTSPADLSEERDALLRPTLALFGEGFLPRETDGTTVWHWAGPRGVVTIARGTTAGPVTVAAGVRTPGTKPSTVVATGADGKTLATVTVNPKATSRLKFTLPEGVDSFVLTTDAPDETADERDLNMQILDLTADAQ